MEMIEKFKEKVIGKGLRVALPEGHDERVIRAARLLKDRQIAIPVVLGKPEKVSEAVEKAGVDISDIEIINPKESDNLDFYAEKYVGERDDITIPIAVRMVSKPVFYAGMMVACGDASTMVGGVATATATIIQSGTLTVGHAEGIHTASSFFLMIIPDFQGEKDKCFIYADCAVNIDPTEEALADIAIASARSAEKLLGIEPKVAMLSFSTKGSASHQRVDKVVRALEIARSKAPGLTIDGEFQADAAIIARVAEKKVKTESAVAGRANVLIFPDLDCGNVAYKLTQYMANARAIGPFLQGFARPISDLSRGASVEDIVSTTAVTLAQL
jgi:phosphate acetyltransferase